MKFVLPCKEYEERAVQFNREFIEHSSRMYGNGGLSWHLENESYDDWLVKVQKDLDIANVAEGRVPAFTYFYVDEGDGRIVGVINIRLALDEFLRKEGGHIGYSIRPSERKKGHGTRMLRGALDFCGVIGLESVIITCDKVNVASANMIKNCGGVLDAEFYSEKIGEVIQRYTIAGGSV